MTLHRRREPKKLHHLGLRISRAEKSLIRAAAAAEDVSLSEFVRHVAVDAAQRTLVQEAGDDPR